MCTSPVCSVLNLTDKDDARAHESLRSHWLAAGHENSVLSSSLHSFVFSSWVFTLSLQILMNDCKNSMRVGGEKIYDV